MDKVYILVNLINCDCTEVAKSLRSEPGVTEVSILDGSPNLHIRIEAAVRRETVAYFLGVLDLIEGLVDDIHVLPVKQLPIKPKVRRPADIQIDNQRKEIVHHV